MKPWVKSFSSPAQRWDLTLLLALLVGAVWLSHTYDLFEQFSEWAEAHEDWQVDELAVIAMFLVVGLGFFSLRRWREALRETEVHRSTAETLQAREADLVTSEERFRQTFDAATTAVALVTIEDGRFQRVNQAGCDILGYAGKELATMTAWEVIHADDLADHGERFRQVARGELPSAETQLRYVRRDGSVAHGLVAVAMVRDIAGNPLHLVIHLVDVNELEQAKRRLVELLSSKDQFIASVAHEIRTPLTAVLGYADILQNGFELSPEDRDAMVSTIIEQATDLSNLVEDLLVAARIDTDNLTVAQVTVDLQAQAAQVVEPLQSDDAQITITGSGAKAIGDPGRVRQILRNFLTNALRYGGSDIRIEIKKDQTWARIAVTDDGPGVPPGDEARIFDAYQTAHNTKARTGSIGLGLNIAVKLAQLMKGEVAYRRHQGRTIFELSLPGATESSLEAVRASQG